MDDTGPMHAGDISSGHLHHTDSQQTMYERDRAEECESFNHTNSSFNKEDETKSLGKEPFESSSATVPPLLKQLTPLEKKFLLAVERGDLPAVKRYILPWH